MSSLLKCKLTNKCKNWLEIFKLFILGFSFYLDHKNKQKCIRAF